jgi:fumarate reductase subunit C
MKLTNQALNETLTIFTYDLLSNKGNEIILDEKIIAREMLLAATWLLVTFISLILVFLFGFNAVFFMAILGALGIGLL